LNTRGFQSSFEYGKLRRLEVAWLDLLPKFSKLYIKNSLKLCEVFSNMLLYDILKFMGKKSTEIFLYAEYIFISRHLVDQRELCVASHSFDGKSKIILRRQVWNKFGHEL